MTTLAAAPPFNPRDIGLRLSTSRQLLELSEPWEIILTIQNNSPITLWVAGMTTALTLPAEVLHPAEVGITARGAQLPTVAGPGFDKVCIPSGGTYNCTWRVNSNKDQMDKQTTFRNLILWNVFFHPGKYVIQATIHFWPQEPDLGRIALPGLMSMSVEEARAAQANIKELENIVVAALAQGASAEGAQQAAEAVRAQRTQSLTDGGTLLSHVAPDNLPERRDPELLALAAKNAQASVLGESIPLAVEGLIEVTGRSLTVLGASGIGGLLAFVFRELTLAIEDSTKVEWSDLLLLPTYTLTAIVMNLVFSRVTEARLPFTIRIMDFWGAITFGIVTALAGNALIKAAFSFFTAP